MIRIRRIELLLGMFLAAVLLAGCQRIPEKSERASNDWSRGEKLGVASLSNQVGLATDSAGENIYLVWIAERRQPPADVLHWVRLDRAGRTVAEHDLPIAADRPAQVKVVLDPRGVLHLTWLARSDGIPCLFYAPLDVSGQLLGAEPRMLSIPTALVGSYAVGPHPAGGLDVFWSAREGQGAGLYYTRWGEGGQTTVENLSLGRQGFGPAFRTDSGGAIHLTWQEEPEPGEYHTYYALYDSRARTLAKPVEIAFFPVSTGLAAYPPVLGLTQDQVYIFWSLERRGGGLTPPTASSYYVAFPLGKPEAAGQPRGVNIPETRRISYERMASSFPVHALGRVAEGSLPSQFLYLPTATQGQATELATAFSVQITSRTQNIVQIILAIWSQGELQGYQVAGQTRSISLRPILISDERNDLHLAWIDTAGFGAYDVYYANTSAEARAHLNRVTLQDALAALLSVAWVLVQSIGFLPIVLAWGFLPLALLAIYSMMRPEGDLARRGPRVVLVLAILLYTAFKYLFRPGWLAALPLPEGLPMALATALIYAAPVVISILAGLATWWYSRRHENASLWPALGLFVGCDVLLTLALYVPGILAE